MKILITGVAGFLGSHLADALIEKGHTIVGVDSLIGGDIENVNQEVDFHPYDCLERDYIATIMKGVDVVYHCACTAHEGLSIFSPHFITTNTFGASLSIISAALSEGVKRFIYCSSASRYGEQITPFTEDMIPRPQDPYGIAKYAAELSLIELGNTHGMEWVVAVPHNIIGTRQKYDDPYRNVASIFMNLMLQGKSPTVYGDGLQERAFTFIDDVVNPLVLMATEPRVNKQVINIGHDASTTTILELATIIKELTGFKGEIIHRADRPREVKVVHLSSDKARRLLAIESKKDLREGLWEMIEDIRKKGTKPFQYKLPIEITNSPLLPVTWRDQLF